MLHRPDTLVRSWCARLSQVILLVINAFVVADVAAHHSDTPHFFMDRNVRHEGVVTEFRFVNPHAYVYFDTTAENGSVESWRCERPPYQQIHRVPRVPTGPGGHRA